MLALGSTVFASDRNERHGTDGSGLRTMLRRHPESEERTKLIFHMTAAADWYAAEPTSEYRLSTRDCTLEDEGFIHCCYANQVTQVANSYYGGLHGLVLLVIDRELLTAPVRDESLDSGNDFPHIYGPLKVDAVTDVLRFEPSDDGIVSLPEAWRTSADVT